MAQPYPARLDARLDEPINRLLWLVKWALLIPHFLCLVVLWMALSLLTIVAGFSILVTARYPRNIFEFNVGVMRWTWRVAFYGINAFGTDAYPPFSLKSDPDYPADFHVDYPERLSRGLVLVKWWLLAIPQYIIVGVLAGGFGLNAGGAWRLTGGGGVIALLALAGAVVLALTGSYPRQLFDVTIGLSRWCFRVLAYVALMRDEYPPFRYDGGGADRGTPPEAPGELPLAA